MSTAEELFLEAIATDDKPDLHVVEATPAGEYAAGLRELADLIDAHPELLPWNTGHWVSIYCEAEEALAQLQSAARAMSPCHKIADDHNFGLVKEFRGGVELKVETARENVCERVKTGEHTEVELDVDAIKEIAGLVGDELPTITRVVEEFAWECPPSLLGHDG